MAGTVGSAVSVRLCDWQSQNGGLQQASLPAEIDVTCASAIRIQSIDPFVCLSTGSARWDVAASLFH
jgi:hypothetical protein